MKGAPVLNVMNQRPAIGVEVQPRQCGECAELPGREFIGAQQVKGGAAWVDQTGLGRSFSHMTVSQSRNLPMNFHQVRHRLGVDHHQVARNGAP